MPLSDAEDAVARLLSRDVAATLGAGYESRVQAPASGAREYIDESDWYAQHVVDEDGWWWCERDGVRVSRLGDLGPRTP